MEDFQEKSKKTKVEDSKIIFENSNSRNKYLKVVENKKHKILEQIGDRNDYKNRRTI